MNPIPFPHLFHPFRSFNKKSDDRVKSGTYNVCSASMIFPNSRLSQIFLGGNGEDFFFAKSLYQLQTVFPIDIAPSKGRSCVWG